MGCIPQPPHVLRRHWLKDADWIAALDGFEQEFGSADLFAVDVPGRVCVLGDHSDYVPYLKATIVTFASSEQRMRALISPRKDRIVRIRSSLDGCENTELTIDVDVVERNSNWLDVLNSRDNVSPHWSNYVRGAVAYSMYIHRIDFGFDMYIHSTIPSSSGTSSSSALTLCGLVAAHLSNDLPWNREELSLMGGQAEWYVGTRGGAMDHATMMCAEKNSMLKLEFGGRGFSAEQLDVGPNDCGWYTVFTHPADKGGPVLDAFNELANVQQSTINDLLEKIGFEHHRGHDGLRCSMNGGGVKWQEVADALPEFVESKEGVKVRVRDRFRYVMREYRRAILFADAVAEGDRGAISRLLEESWIDTRVLLGTHTEEMELVAAGLRQMGGVLGVKVLGAGFGGNLLVYAEDAADLGGRFIKHTPGSGLRLIDVESDD